MTTLDQILLINEHDRTSEQALVIQYMHEALTLRRRVAELEAQLASDPEPDRHGNGYNATASGY